MGKKIQLSVPVPCHENWDAMTPVDKGKFCDSCQKQVVDFSRMSDREVAIFFKKPSKGSICGRFMNDQLDRDMEIPRKRIPWVKYFFQFVLPAFLFSIKATAQGTVRVITTTSDTTKTPFSKQIIKLGQVKKPVCTKPLIGDTVIASPKPDSNLTITGEIKNETEVQETNVEITKAFNDTITLPEVVVTDYPKMMIRGQVIPTCATSIKVDSPKYDNQLIQGRLGGVFISRTVIAVKPLDSLFKKFLKQPAEIFFKVFPNPSKSGASINIEWKGNEAGYYLLHLLNLSGQPILTKEMWIDEEARVLNVPLHSVAAGTYFLRMTSKRSGKENAEKIIIQ